ncbi:MAG TPA: hypothetical protein VD758_11650 [Gemmatimonadaceae bacterium]|nr:hypothetical protein [Gemmatimonadaceae bacterium]
MRRTFTLALVLFAGGCKRVDSVNRRSDTTVVPPVRASVPESTIAQTDSGPVKTVTCGVTPKTHLTDEGIGDLKPGLAVEEVKRLCDVTSDSYQPGPEGQKERIVGVRLGADIVPVTIADNKVYRIDVRTPRFQTPDSLGIDTPLHRIARMRGAQFAPGEDGVYGFVADHCGLSFRFSLPLRPPKGGQWTAATIDKDHGDAVVDRVLVVRCRK